MSSDEQKIRIKEKRLRDWTKEKLNLSNNWIRNQEKQRNRKIEQRGVYWCELGENLGSEQNTENNERRPVLVLSNNIINPKDPNILIAPLSKQLKTKKGKGGREVPKYNSQFFLYRQKYSFLTNDSAVMTEATRNVSKVRIASRLGEINEEDYKKVLAKLHWTTGI